MRRILVLVDLVLLLVATWMALTVGQVVASEKNVTVEKNIVYVHVPSAICTTICFVVLLTAGIAYLWTNKPIWDFIGAASAEVALVFATVLNVTGSIFSRPFWNTWWTPSPRLVSSAVLWFLCVAYFILRTNIQDRQRRAAVCAVFGVLAFLDVPIVYLTARLMPDIHIAKVSFESQWQSVSFILSIVGTVLLGGLLIWFRTDILSCKAKLEERLTG